MLTNVGKRAMLRALSSPGNDENPFVQDGENTFIKYDEQHIILIEVNGFRTLCIEFYWRGESVCEKKVQCDLASGQRAVLLCPGGRIPIEVS